MSQIARLLSWGTSDRSSEQENPDVIAIDDNMADELFSVLSSETSRNILSRLYEQPRTASEITKIVDTSLQNVNYHLNKLEESGLTEVSETRYSDQGKEMNVYTPTNRALVLFASDDFNRSSLVALLKRHLLSLSVLVAVSIVLDIIIRRVLLPASPSPPTPDGPSPNPTPGTPTSDMVTLGVSPGMIFLLDGVLMLVFIIYRDRKRLFVGGVPIIGFDRD